MLKESGCIMAFDFGMNRIGVAIGNSVLKIPHPLALITGKNKFEKFAKIKVLVEKWRPELFVVGMPGDVGQITDDFDPSTENKNDWQKIQLINNIKRFSNRLKEQFKLKVEFVNEEYSSAIAASKLNEQAVFAVAQKTKLDIVAATIILQRYLDNITS